MATPHLKGRVSLDDAGFFGTLRRTQRGARLWATQMGSVMRSSVGRIGGMLGAGLSARAFAGAIGGSIKLGGQLHNLSKSTGIAVGELYDLQGVFAENDMEAGAVATTMARMQKAVSDGSKSIRELGLSSSELQKLTPAQQLQKVSEAIMKIPDPADRAAAAMKIFGRSGATLLPTLEQIATMDFSKLSAAAQHIQKNAKAFDELGDKITKAQRSRDAFFAGVTSEIMDTLTGAVDSANGGDAVAAGEKFGGFLSEGIKRAMKMLQSDMKMFDWIDEKFGGGAGKKALQSVTKPAEKAVDVASGSGWGRLEGFRSFTDPLKPGDRESKRTADFYKFFGAGGNKPDLGAVGSLTAGPKGSTGSIEGMNKAYNQSYINKAAEAKANLKKEGEGDPTLKDILKEIKNITADNE